MLRRLVAGLTFCAAVYGSLGPGALASRPGSFYVRSVTLATSRHDVAPKGPSVGDTSTERDRLINPVAQFGGPAGAVVGRDRLRIVLTGPSSAAVTGMVVLPGGTLEVKGTIRRTGPRGVYPIVSGTGRFLHAHGTVAIIGAGARPLNRFKLSYSP